MTYNLCMMYARHNIKYQENQGFVYLFFISHELSVNNFGKVFYKNALILYSCQIKDSWTFLFSLRIMRHSWDELIWSLCLVSNFYLDTIHLFYLQNSDYDAFLLRISILWALLAQRFQLFHMRQWRLSSDTQTSYCHAYLHLKPFYFLILLFYYEEKTI